MSYLITLFKKACLQSRHAAKNIKLLFMSKDESMSLNTEDCNYNTVGDLKPSCINHQWTGQ